MLDAAGAPVTWMPITGSNPTWTITASPIDEALIGSTLNYELEIKFADARYPTPNKKMSLPTTITAATCDCDRLTWDIPTRVDDAVEVALGPKTVTIPTATMNAGSKLPTPEIRKCFAAGGGDCAFTTTYAPVLPATGFIVQTGTTAAIVATPTTSAHMGTHTISVVQTITYTNFGTTATVTFDGVQVVVGCTITSVPNPTPPSTGLTYTLYDN